MSDIAPQDCVACGGARLMLAGWQGPTHTAPFPEPCARCSPNMSPRERQGVQVAWLIDNAHRPDVKDTLARMATFHAKKYQMVLHLPDTEEWTSAAGVLYTHIAEADLVVVKDGRVVKDRYGAGGYHLSSHEIARIKDDCQEFREIRR